MEEIVLEIGDFKCSVTELKIKDSTQHKERCEQAKAVTKLVKNNYKIHGSIEIISPESDCKKS